MLLKEKSQKLLRNASLYKNVCYLVYQILNKVLKKYEKHMDAFSIAVK